MNSYPRSKTYFKSKIFLEDQYIGDLQYDLNWKYTHKFGAIPDGLEHKRYAFDQIPKFVLDRLPKKNSHEVKSYLEIFQEDPDDYVALFIVFGRENKNSPWTVQLVRQWRE